jgi:hypothetical protein
MFVQRARTALMESPFVMPGLDPGIHLSKKDGLPGHRRAEATPFFERLCPAMTTCKCFRQKRSLKKAQGAAGITAAAPRLAGQLGQGTTGSGLRRTSRGNVPGRGGRWPTRFRDAVI